VVADAKITNDERDALSKEIVRQGCRYAVCTGFQCSKWDDSIDTAFIATDPNFSPPEERFIMTTWHENDPIEDVSNFFRWNTTFENFSPQHYLVILVGGDAETAHIVRPPSSGRSELEIEPLLSLRTSMYVFP
jgi:hypothetical protein